MKKLLEKLQKTRRLWLCLLLAAFLFLVFFVVWLLAIRPNASKSLSVKLCDSYDLTSEPISGTVSQTFTVEQDITALAFVFYTSGEQPVGDIDLELADAATGEVLAVSTGDMINLVSGQYAGLGLSQTVSGSEDRTLCATLTPHYQGDGRLAVGYSSTPVLEGQAFSVNGRALEGTLALLATCNPIGRFLSLYYWALALLLTGILCLCCLFATAARLNLHRAVFVVVLLLGIAFTMVLPPYAAPDEQYHINQSFTLACQIANRFSGEDWVMEHIPTNYSYRRVGDSDETIQDANTTVFTWRRLTEQLNSTTDEPFDSHWEYSDAQVDNNQHLYLISALGVFLGFILHLGFVPVLLLGRLFNLVAFALFVSYAVYRTPIAKPAFLVTALLPMTLHLAASFSRDSLLLGLCFLFTALCLDAIDSPKKRLSRKQLAALGLLGIMIAPCKLVYVPLIALIFLIPAAKLGPHALRLRLGYLACCLLVFVGLNFSTFSGFLFPARHAQTEASRQAAQQTAQDTLSAQQAQPHAPPNTVSEAASESSSAAENLSAASLVPEDVESQPAESESFVSPVRDEVPAARGINIRALVIRTYTTTLGETPSEDDLDYWISAMERGYLNLCGFLQPFFLSEPYSSQNKTDRELVLDFTYVLHDTAPTQEDFDTWLPYFATTDTRLMKLNYYLQNYLNVNPYAEIGVPPGDIDLTQAELTIEEVRSLMDVKFAEDEQKLPEEDTICYNAAYILSHPLATLALVANSVLKNGDHYIRTLVGGSLSYYSLNIAWGWVLLLYLLLAAACISVPGQPILSGGNRLWVALCALACCGLAVLGCISWTPTYYTTIYGLQGRYFLPVLPLLLAVLRPRSLTAQRDLTVPLLFCIAAANAGVLLNATLAVIAR